jgi:hypothetical protein
MRSLAMVPNHAFSLSDRADRVPKRLQITGSPINHNRAVSHQGNL